MPDGTDAPARGLPALEVVLAPEPFRPRVEHRTAPAGLSIAEILLEACQTGVLDVQDLERTDVYIDGELVEDRAAIGELRPRPGAVVNIAVQVYGGGRGGSKALQTVLQVAIMAAAFAVAGPAGAFVGNAVGFAGGAGSAAAFAAGQAIGSIAAVSAVGLAGAALGQALFAPKKDASSQIYSLETQSNQARLREPMPLMLGNQRFAFDVASSAYTTFDGDDMWLTVIYGIHYGPCQVSGLQIGETPIEAYAAGDVQIEQFLTPGPRNSQLFPADIHQDSFENTLDREHGDPALATTVDDATTVEFDFVWAGGLYYPKDDGREVTSDTKIYVEISPYSQGAWQPAPGLPAGRDKSGANYPAGTYYVTAAQKDPLRKTLKVTLPSPGKWDVRIHRDTRPVTDTNNDTVTWTAIRMPLPGPAILDQTLSIIVVKLKAAQDLSGQAGVVSGIVCPIIPIPGPNRDWSVTGATSNAAALARWLLTGLAAAAPLDPTEIDASCADQYDLITANAWEASIRIADASTQQDVLNKLAAAGRCLIYWSGSALCFVPDWTKPGPRLLFGGRNATDYRRKRIYPDPVHAVWVQFTNAGEDWKQDGLYVYADGYDATNATLIETLSLDFGCLPDRAHREGRVWLARRFDQVWSHEFTAGADAVTASYGARVRARRTSGLYGETDARVRFRHWSGELVAGVRLDDAVEMTAGQSYALDVRSDDVFLDGLALTTTPGQSRDVYFAAPLAADLAPRKDDLVAFGLVNHVTEDLEITDVDPQSDRSVRITARNYIGPALVAAETGPIPPLATFLSTRVAAPQPVIVAVQGSPDGVIIAFTVDPQKTATLKGFVARWRVKPAAGDDASWATLPLLGPNARTAVTPSIPGAQHQPDDVDAQIIVQAEIWSVLSTGESSPATSVEVIVVQGVPPVGDFAAVGAVRTATDGSSYPVLQITADAITAGAVQDLVVEVQPHGSIPESWVSAGPSLPAANPNGDYPGFAGGAVLDVRGRWRDANGWVGDWATAEATIPSGALVSASTASVPGSAAFGDTGETVTEVLAAYDAQIAQISKDVQDGVSAVSADAQAAAASALAAESAEQASASAEAAAQQAVNDSRAARDAAGVARDAALNDAGAAQASATQAGGAAGNAQTYASQASVAAGSASANASAAMIAGVSATTAAASSFPERVGSAGQYFSLTYNGAPGSVGPIPSSGPTSVVSDSALGLVITEAGIGQDIVTQGALPYVAGRTYEVTLDYAQRVNGAAARTADVVCMGLDASYATTAPVFSTAAPAISDGARQTLTWRFADAGGANTTAIATSSSLIWLRFSARLNLVADRSSRATDATASMVRLSVKDITQEITAQGFANAAATSASSAAASQSDAGQSASSASTSATNANTSAGQASTDAGQASTSASNAQGSANTAGTYAGQASVSASGAAAYAGQANTSATDAQGSASSASTYSNQAQGYSGSAQNYASSAGSSAAAASSNAAAAQQSATLSASVSTNALNPNCDFNVWSNAAGLPDGYGFWANSDNTSRGGGVNGKPYAVLQSPAAGEQLGFTMGGLRKSRGWYVIEADVRIKGSFAGAGVAFNTSSEDLTVSFSQDPDTNGIVRSTSENDYWVYKWRKLVQANVEDYGASLFAFTACTGLGDVSAVRSIYWDHVAVRPATDGEIAGKQALTNANTALAQISSNASAQASLNTAQATTNATLSAQVNTRPNLLAPLETGISGWRTYNGAGLYAGTNYWGAIAYLGGIASGQTVCTIDSPYVTMPGGVVLTAALDSVGIDSDSSILTQSQIVSVNASGQETTVAYNQFTGSHDFSTDPGARNKLACSGTTLSDCVKVYVRTVFYLNSGSFQACQVRQVKLEKGGLPCTAYSTEAGVSSLAASVSISQGAIATLQGKSVAWWQLNVNAADSQAYILAQADGQAGSAIAIAADYISLYNRAAGSIIKALQVIGGNVYVANRLYVGSTIYLDPAIPAIVFDNGSAAFALGTRLGANADMIAWFGPSQPVTSMTRTNSAFYLGTDGTAFFSGAIRAGKLYNSIQGTDSGASAQTTLGPFGTQGGTITVPWSYSWYRTGQRVGNQSASGSTSVTVTLYRTAAGQAEQQVDQLNLTGQTTAEFDGEDNNTLFTETMSGSKTFSDTYGGTLNRTYRVQISNRVITTFNGSTYQNKADGIQQTLGLVSSEG